MKDTNDIKKSTEKKARAGKSEVKKPVKTDAQKAKKPKKPADKKTKKPAKADKKKQRAAEPKKLTKKEQKALDRRRAKLRGKSTLAVLGIAVGAAAAAYIKDKILKKNAAVDQVSEELEGKLHLIAADRRTDYSVVYGAQLDGGEREELKSGDAEARIAKQLALELRHTLGAEFFVRSSALREDEDASELYEILIGDTRRAESDAFRDSLGMGEYGFYVTGRKIVISGRNLTSTEYAATLFSDFIKKRVERNESGKTLVLSDGLRVTDIAPEWLVDIPRYDGGKYYGENDCDLGSLMVYYTDTDAEDFEAYCKKLADQGYTLWQRNDILENLHAVYTGERGMIYVSYAANEHAVRIVTTPAGKYSLPDSITPQRGKKVADATLTQLACDYTKGNYGMAYIVTLENGNFCVIDGGDNGAEDKFAHVLFSKLKAMNKRPDGKIVVEGWFMSHIHVDHYRAFMNLCFEYGGEIEIRRLLLNTVSKNYGCNLGNPDRKLQKNLDKIAQSLAAPMKVVKVHTGMKFCLGDAEFEILHTAEDVFPVPIEKFNDTSIAWRMRYKGQSVMFLGDIFDKSSGAMCRRYGSYLKSDIVQVAHHGYDGATVALYTYIGADVALWPNHQKRFEHVTNPEYKRYAENHYLLTTCKEIIIAERDATLKLPYKIRKKK